MPSRQASIAVRLITVIVAVVTALMAAAGVVSYRMVRDQLAESLAEERATLAEQMAVALVHPVWAFDREQIERLMASALHNANVEQVIVRLVDRNAAELVRSRSGRLATGTPPTLTAESRPIEYEGEALGTVTLLVSAQRVEANVRRYLLWIVVRVVATDLALIAGLTWLLWRFVLRPLRRIEAFAVERAATDSTRTRIEGPGFSGEFERLRDALERMLGNLERRHAELVETSRRLEEERAKLRALFQILPVGISIVDRERRVLETNPALERISGLTQEEFQHGKHALRRYVDAHGEPMPFADLPTGRALREQREVLHEEVKIIKEDGTAVWVSMSAAPLGDQGTAVTSVVDITGRKQGEQQLAAQLAELKRWQAVMLDRENRVRDLKAEVNQLCLRLGEPPRYSSQPLNPSGPAETRPRAEGGNR